MEKIKLYCLSGFIFGMSAMYCFSQNEDLSVNTNDTLNLAISGYANLYYVKTSNGTVFYAQKQGEEIREISEKHLNGFLKAFFSDCDKDFFSNIEKVDIFYDKLTLSNLFLKYNKCKNNGEYTSVTHGYPKVRHGLKAGLNICDYTNYPFNVYYEINMDRKFGFTGGYYFNLAISKHVSFQPEVLYCYKGASAKDSLVDFTTHFVEIPFLVKISFLDKRISPYVLVGPNMNLEIQKEAFKNGVPLEYSTRFFNLVYGVGAEIKINTKNLLMFEARLDYNMVNSNTVYEIKNINAQFMVGFTF